MAKFTLDQITEALEAVVRERGEDYNYLAHFDECEYIGVPLDAASSKAIPACIVGATYSYLGVSNKTLKRWTDNSGSSSSIDCIVSPLIPKEALKPLMAAQTYQDQGMSWGEALREYKNAALNG
jgi:hypothetical protein